MSALPQTRPFILARRIAPLAAAIAVVLGVCIVLTAESAAALHAGRWVAGLQNGCIVIGSDSALVSNYGANPVATGSWGVLTRSLGPTTFIHAWRPFRAGSGSNSRVFIPLWHPTLLLAIAAAFSFGMISGGRRAQRGYCTRCGYDLRGLPAGAERRCPECGTEARAAATGSVTTVNA